MYYYVEIFALLPHNLSYYNCELKCQVNALATVYMYIEITYTMQGILVNSNEKNTVTAYTCY